MTTRDTTQRLGALALSLLPPAPEDVAGLALGLRHVDDRLDAGRAVRWATWELRALGRRVTTDEQAALATAALAVASADGNVEASELEVLVRAFAMLPGASEVNARQVAVLVQACARRLAEDGAELALSRAAEKLDDGALGRAAVRLAAVVLAANGRIDANEPNALAEVARRVHCDSIAIPSVVRDAFTFGRAPEPTPRRRPRPRPRPTTSRRVGVSR